jgi:hypothetical protein
MTRFASFGVFVGLMAGSACPPAIAHHSYADFDMTRTISLSGTVQSYDWSNPHVSFKMAVTSTDRTKVWNIESHAPAIMSHHGWTASTLKPGSAVLVVCSPKRDASSGCRLHTLTLLKTGQLLETKLSRSIKAGGAP